MAQRLESMRYSFEICLGNEENYGKGCPVGISCKRLDEGLESHGLSTNF